MTSDDFLAHYGKKGMKWGVTSVSPSTKAARKSAKANLRKEYDNNFRDRILVKSDAVPNGITQKKAKQALVMDMASLGMYSGAQIARSAGYSKGKSVTIGILGGPPGAMLASEIRVQRTINSRIK